MNYAPWASELLTTPKPGPAAGPSALPHPGAGIGSRRHLWLAVGALISLLASPAWAAGLSDPLAWPASTREQRPWAYWWWMGSAVDPTNLTRELTRYREAGYGGVHIIPIYGAKGWETNYLTFLSPRWMEMLRHTVAEANRLDLGVDMTTGSGWCFGGGPNVTEAEGNANVVVKTFAVAAGGSLAERLNAKQIQALVAYGSDGKATDLTSKLRPDGSVNWQTKEAVTVYAISQKFSGQKVKRASPGGEGPMLNLLYPAAMAKFLQPFTDAFAKYDGPKPRAQYHDSYEYKSDWSPVFLQEFEKRRGYRLQDELPALFNKATNDHAARVLCDYRETVSDIMVEESLPQWVKWSHDRGFLTRNEAHGSPGNLLDLYALADVPETEMFRLDRNRLISKFASSAAHVAGRKLVGCETGTWLKEHFTETLADMKYLLDDLFLSGVNHVLYHGTCYSPDEAPWPGWVFYASYEMNPRNAVWRDARALNEYVARCQSILQSGQPDNDILLYWPLHDFWSEPGRPLLPHFTVHARGWFEDQPVGRLADQLWRRGYAFDYASDRQLAAATVQRGQILTTGGCYRVVLVPVCERMPVATLRQLLALAEGGATVIFESRLPLDVPGLGELDWRRRQFEQLGAKLPPAAGSGSFANSGTQRIALGKGQVLVGEVEPSLAEGRVSREPLFDTAGLMGLRRAFAGGKHYFVANRGEQPFAAWLPLATAAQSVGLLDPLTGRGGRLAWRRAAVGGEVYLELPPGGSVLLRAWTDEPVTAPSWTWWRAAGPARELTGAWKLQFLSGGPTIPAGYSMLRADSWTATGDAGAQSFSGTASYSLAFDAPAATGRHRIELGKVVQSARVRLNGKDFGTLITPPFAVTVDNLQPTGNQLKVEVTSTSANRIRDLDRRGVKWQSFHDINFVNQEYKPFNAASWPVAEAGLLGPVTLTPVEEVKP